MKIIFSVGQVKPPDLHHETISKGLLRLASENGFELSGLPLQIKRIEILDSVKHMKVVNSPSMVMMMLMMMMMVMMMKIMMMMMMMLMMMMMMKRMWQTTGMMMRRMIRMRR